MREAVNINVLDEKIGLAKKATEVIITDLV